jgi:hypothetical protein
LNQSECIFPCTNDTVCNAACNIAHSIICTRPFRGKMHSDWFNGIEILQGRWQHGDKEGYCYPSGLENTLCTWDIYVPLVPKVLKDLRKPLFLKWYGYIIWSWSIHWRWINYSNYQLRGIWKYNQIRWTLNERKGSGCGVLKRTPSV